MRIRSRLPSTPVLLLAALLILGAVLAWWPPSAPPRPAAQPGADAADGAGPPWLDPPVPLAPGASHVETRVLASGDLRVTHWVRSESRLSDVRLAVPDMVAPGARTPSPLASRVTVAVDGARVPGPRTVDGEPRDFPVPDGTTLYVTYVLEDALERSPSAQGRALVRVTSLALSHRPLPTARTQVVTGARVQALACVPADAQDAAPVPCGSPAEQHVSDGSWEVRLQGEEVDDRVIAQIDLV